jgi:hypothetical protein
MSSWSRSQCLFKYEKPDTHKQLIPFVGESVVHPKRNLINIVYATPKCTDTAVLIVFFNPSGSFRILQNLLYVKQQLERSSIPLFIGELAYHEAPHMINAEGKGKGKGASTTVFQFRSASYMFSKENLLNAMLAKDELKSYSKYVIMDCDIVFDTCDWVDGISIALDTYDVIQPYQYANVLNLKFKSEAVKTGIVYEPAFGHPGYVWAFRRDWFDSVGGLYEYALIGGGDICFANMIGVLPKLITNVYKHDLPPHTSSTTKTSYLPYTIWHLPHGQQEKRQYNERMTAIRSAMTALRIDCLQNAVDRGSDGIFEWKPMYSAHLNSVLLNYFKSREDDG